MHTTEQIKLEKHIQSLLASNPSLKDADVSVSVRRGTVRLEGVAKDLSQIMAIMAAIRPVPGVKHIENQMRVRGRDSQFDDTAITAAVKSSLLGERGMSLLNVHVATQEGVVTLTGEANNKECACRAADLAKSCDGVVEVRNLIEEVHA